MVYRTHLEKKIDELWTNSLMFFDEISSFFIDDHLCILKYINNKLYCIIRLHVKFWKLKMDTEYIVEYIDGLRNTRVGNYAVFFA